MLTCKVTSINIRTTDDIIADMVSGMPSVNIAQFTTIINDKPVNFAYDCNTASGVAGYTADALYPEAGLIQSLLTQNYYATLRSDRLVVTNV